MRKSILVLAAALAIAAGAFAESANKKGSMLVAPGEVNVTVGFDFGLGVNGGFEYPIGSFRIGEVPFSYGAKAVGNVYFAGDYTYFGVGGVGTLHFSWGSLDLPKELAWVRNIDTFVGIGLGFSGSNFGTGGLGLFSHGGSSYFFSKDMAVTVAGGIGGSYIGLLWEM